MSPAGPARRVVAGLSLLAAVASTGSLAGCSRSPQEAYCDEVGDHQAALSDVAASEDPGALFDALDDYDDLREEAPRDVVDEWDAVVGPLHQLHDALEAHDVDPSAYTAGRPPAGLAPEAREEIEAAARAVGSTRTVEAMGSLEQHALDVCGEPLSR